MKTTPSPPKPELTAGPPGETVSVMDETGAWREVAVTGEQPLTLLVNNRELVTLMTLGRHPELLAIGWLRNQGFLEQASELLSVEVVWDAQTVILFIQNDLTGWEKKLAKRTVTTGCGQGTVFGELVGDLERYQLPRPSVRQSTLYALLRNLKHCNDVYRVSGAVHGCALCEQDQVRFFVEDVGRHNAADAIAGHMLLEGVQGGDKVFYTTGRLTSEMVIKTAQMGIPVLISRAGVTRMGLDLAQRLGVTLISRAGGKHFLVYHGADTLILDEPPGP